MKIIGFIIAREFLSRVKKRSFILMTFLTPLIFILITGIPSKMLMDEDLATKKILVIDNSEGNYYMQALASSDRFSFIDANSDYTNNSKETEIYATLEIITPSNSYKPTATIYSNNAIPEELEKFINEKISQYATIKKLESVYPNLSEQIKVSKETVLLQKIQYNEEDESSATILALSSAFLLYIFIFIYGAQVMRGITEEKSNRVVEIMFLTVKPIKLLAGKIIGIAFVGLFQFSLWIIALALLYTANGNGITDNLLTEYFNPETGKLVILFIIYFILGYLLYATMFAVIGAISGPGTDTQQFILPVSCPIIFAIYAGIYASYFPNGELSIWCSYIPFTSPIVMMTRSCFEIDITSIIISIVILVITTGIFLLMAEKIYKTAILLHGKKISYKDILQFVKK